MPPVVYLAFNRPDLVRRSLASLLAQSSIQNRRIYVVIDGPRGDVLEDEPRVAEVERIVTDMLRTRHSDWELWANPINVGLAENVISVMTRLFRRHDALVVLEDDLLLARGFLSFIDQALAKYEDHPEVLSVSGFSYPMTYTNDNYDVAFGRRASSWGWATWSDRWGAVDWHTPVTLTREQRRAFAAISSDLPRMLERQQSEVISSWAIRWVHHQFKWKMVDVFPRQTLVENIGYRSDSTNCKDDVRAWHSVFAPYANGPWRLPNAPLLEDDVMRQLAGFNSRAARALRVLRRFKNRVLSAFL